MEGGGEGMVAVVHGLRDSGLAVTLLDGSRQYTLMPNYSNPPSPVRASSPTQAHIAHECARAQTQATCAETRCESAAQATDGRYASMYKMAHCRVTPTSPPVQLTEFPPQRAELCPGHGNFEVGGSGSGENYSPCRSSGSFRGAMSWPDRGSVCSPRPSREPDVFANSLRKYPNISMERSSEMIDRLITYTQAKNLSKSYQSRYPSPSRHSTESNTSNQIGLDRNSSRNAVPKTGSCQKNSYEPEVNVSSKVRPRMEESPTRGQRGDCDCTDYRRQVMRADKYYKDMTRKVKENIRSMAAYPYSQPMLSPVSRDRYEHNSLPGQKTSSFLSATNSVNMEVQAATEMVSKEVATVARAEPIQRTVAVPLSPTSSSEDQKPEGDVSEQRHVKLNPKLPTYKSVETGSMPVDLSVQTTSSFVHTANNYQKLDLIKSNENLNRHFNEEIFDLLEKVSVFPNRDPQACDLRHEVLKEMSLKLKKMTETMNWDEGTEKTRDQIRQLLKSGDVQAYKDAISDEIISRMNRYRFVDVNRAETHVCFTNEERHLDTMLQYWLSNIPLKSCDISGKPVEKDSIIQKTINRLKHLIRRKHKNDERYALKWEIIEVISNLPITINEYYRSEYLHNLAESLLNYLKPNIIVKNSNGDRFVPELSTTNQRMKIIHRQFKNYIQPTEEEIKEYISDEVKQLLEKNCSKMNSVSMREIEIIDYLIDSIRAIRSSVDYVESELTMLLCQDIDNISWSEAKTLARKLLKLVKNMFSSNTNQIVTPSISYQPQAYVIQNASTSCSQPNNTYGSHDSSNNSIEGISKGDIDANLEAYMNQLTAQIDEWLASSQMQIPQAHDSGFRQVVVHDLAGDIIDRHKYLEVNPSSRRTDSDELEHLKYQIFKWINKLAGEENMDTIRHAPELMQRIQSIPVPMLTRAQPNRTISGNTYQYNTLNNSSSMPKTGNINPSQIQSMSIKRPRASVSQSLVMSNMSASCCSSTHLKPSTPSLKKLNEEYDEFVKKWVQEIPIPSNTPAEKTLADKARAGIYNGVWKAITKLKFEPATFNNPFYYEDALDDELEELLSALPKSSELDTKKHLLKVQLIARTTNTNELIKSSAARASFKQQLVESVSNSLPHRTGNKKEPKQTHEELQIQELVEDYILCANYKEVDKSKANVYRKKLIQEAQALVNSLKKTHNKELKDVDTDAYINNILNAVHKVPLPNKEIIKDEVKEIMLGTEINQWMLDIPVAPDDCNDQLQRKKLKDALLRKIREIENEVNIFDCKGERVLKHEISSFLQNVPVKQGENLNITFMTEEFANRMKNRAKEQQAGNGTRKSVAFMDSVGYYEFSQQMPHCSSFSESPGARPAVANQSSYMIREGTRVKDPYGYNYYAEASLPPHVPLPSEEYFTLEDSQATSNPKQPPMQQQVQEQNQYSKIQSYESIPPVTLHGTIDQSIDSHAQSYIETTRNRPVTPTQERQLSQAGRGVAESQVPQQTIQGITQSGQARFSNARADQFSPVRPGIVQAQTPCSARNEGNKSRVSTQERVSTPRQIIVANPEGVGTSPLPQTPSRSSVPVQPPQSGSFRAVEQQQASTSRRASPPRAAPGQTSTYGDPQWFSTPQQVIAQGSPPRPGRKTARGSQRNKRKLQRRRLELDDDTEEDFETEVDEPCHCMERMMRCGRLPVCYAFQNFDMTLPLVTTNFTVQLCGDVGTGAKSGNRESTYHTEAHRSIKSVQTSFSSVNLVPTEKSCNSCNRKIKSQEDLRNRDKDIQLENEVLEWLKGTCTGEVTSRWSEKMQRLAQKLNRPGGEEKIREKIQKYLRRVPNQFFESVEEQTELREQLPNTIIKKLKKIYLKPERRRNYSSPARIFRIEIPKDNYNVEDKLKSVIKNWMKDIPIKKRDFLGRYIRKEDVIDSIVVELEPFILNRENFDIGHRSTLKGTIIDILNEMPVETNGLDKTSYYNRQALLLLNDIIHMTDEYYTATSNAEACKNSQHNKLLKEFISNQIANILNKLHLSASTKRLELLEEELKDEFEIINTNGYDCSDGATKDNVYTILHKLGGLSEYQANYFTDVILKHFKEFNEKKQENVSPRYKIDTTKVLYNDIYSVFHNPADVKSKTPDKFIKITKDLTIFDEIKSNMVFYKHWIIVQIEDWLNELHVNIPFGNRDKAIRELAEDIIDRFKYLEINTISKGTDENELQYLKYQIFKWINKVAGENTTETIEHADKLMKRIQSIDFPSSVKSEKEKCKLTLSSETKQTEGYHQLKQVIVECLSNIDDLEDVAKISDIIDDLALHLIEAIEKVTDVDDAINKEIDRWMKNIYKGKYKWVVKDTLKRCIKNCLCPTLSLRFDSKTEKKMIRKYEDMIDECIDDYAKRSAETININNRNKICHDLAVQLFEYVNGEVKVNVDYLENVAMKWVEIFIGKQPFWHECVSKLIESILDYNNKVLDQLNQKENDMDKCHVRTEKKIGVAVYGVTLPSNHKAGKTSAANNSIRDINDDDVQVGLDLYLKQLVEQIDNWLGTLDISQIHDKGFREIVVNDLAGDIIDRHKYLELNPSSRGSDQSELEQLKYQIFKWINKLVGDDQHETIKHASELMNRIRSVPVPMLTKHSETYDKRTDHVTNRNVDSRTPKSKAAANPSNAQLSSPPGFTTGGMATTNKRNVVEMPLFSPQVARGSLPAKLNTNITDKRLSGPPALGIPKTPTRQLQNNSEEQEKHPEVKSLEEVYQHFDVIFQERAKEIPLETPTPEQEVLADLARKGIYNGIWKTYFQLKADPEIENDYSYFEMVFEDQLDNMLDCLPQTGEIQKMRHAWKVKVLCDILSMLKHVHSITDRPSFRQMIEKKLNRQCLRARNLKETYLIQQLCAANVAKNYILHSKYKIEDPVKAEVYRQRLMKRVEELAESIKSQGNVDFRSINNAQFCQMALKLLASVPIPHDETLKDEAEEILITEEIDQWYSGLPVKPVRNETDVDLRKRMRELLARKLYEIEKRVDLDESAEQDFRHEISKFLQEKAELQPNVDLEIDFMVEELTNRLKNRRQHNELGYDSFEREKPLSSTLAQTDPGEVLAPLVDAGVNVEEASPYEYQEGVNRVSLSSQPQVFETSNRGHFFQGQMPSCCQGVPDQNVLGSSQIAGPSDQVPYQRKISQSSPCCHSQGALGTSQIAGPSSQVPSQSRMSQIPYPCCQTSQGVLGTNQVAGPIRQDSFPRRMRGQDVTGASEVACPNGQGYQQPVSQMPPPCCQSPGILRTSQTAGPEQGIAPLERFPNQSYHASDPERSQYPNAIPCANVPPSQMGPQINPENLVDRGQPSSNLPPSADFLTMQPSGVTRSTARIVSSVPEELDEETDGEDEVRYKCRCMERVWKCKNPRIRENLRPRCYPMPFPCRYFY